MQRDPEHTDCEQCVLLGMCKRHPNIPKPKGSRNFKICKGDFGPFQRSKHFALWDKTESLPDVEKNFSRRYASPLITFAKAMFSWASSGFANTPKSEFERRLAICRNCPESKHSEESVCSTCSCKIKSKAELSTESCPLGFWTTAFEPLYRKIENPNRHLMYHIFPKKENLDCVKYNVGLLLQHIEQFNGVRSIGIAQEDGVTSSVEEVKALFDGHRIDNWIVKPNLQSRAEGSTFLDLLKTIPTGPDDITFFAHAKGVKHTRMLSKHKAIQYWVETMYEVLLSQPSRVLKAIEYSKMTGCFKRYGQFRFTGNYRWHYSGTFFWFRNMEASQSDRYNYLYPAYACVEAWPGFLFPATETSCMFYDNAGELYNLKEWENSILPLVVKRRQILGTYPLQCMQPTDPKQTVSG